MKKFLIFDPNLLFYGFAVVFFASYGQTFFISIFNSEIRDTYQLTDGQFGLVYALGTLSSSLILVLFARLIDHIDLRLYTFIISLGLSLACLGMYYSFSFIYFLFLIIFALRFFGQGTMDHAGRTSMSRYFGNNRGKAISVATLGGQLGVMFLPIVAVKLLLVMSWESVWLLAGFSIIFLFIPMMIFILRNHNLRDSLFKESANELNMGRKWKTREILSNKNFYIYLPLTVSSPFIGTGLMFHQVFIIKNKGWTLEMLASGYILLGIFSIFGLMFGGPIVDKFSSKKVVKFSLLPLFFAIIVLLFFESYFAMFIYLSLIGLNLGIGAPFVGSLWAEIYGLKSLGTVKALIQASTVFASALSPVIFGYIIDFGMGIFTIGFIGILIIIMSSSLVIIYQNIK